MQYLSLPPPSTMEVRALLEEEEIESGADASHFGNLIWRLKEELLRDASIAEGSGKAKDSKKRPESKENTSSEPNVSFARQINIGVWLVFFRVVRRDHERLDLLWNQPTRQQLRFFLSFFFCFSSLFLE